MGKLGNNNDLGKLVDSRPLQLLPTRQQRIEQRRKKKEGPDNAGPSWFHMPAAKLTPELETDVRLLRMRQGLDPKQHYRKGEKLLQGKYYQVGTVISDPTARYSERLTRRQRGRTILETLLKDTERQQYLKKKYNALQEVRLQNSRTPRNQRCINRHRK